MFVLSIYRGVTDVLSLASIFIPYSGVAPVHALSSAPPVLTADFE